MRTITKTIYQFGELLHAQKTDKKFTKAVDNAREWMIEGFQSFEWWDTTYETWKSALDQIGFTDADLAFSGFSSQGDGASFTCKRVDVAKLTAFMSTDVAPSTVISFDGKVEDFRPWLVHQAHGKSPSNPKYRRILPDYSFASVTRDSSRYVHENTCHFEIECPEAKTPLQLLLNSFQLDVEHLRRDLSRALYRQLEEEWNYQTADEQLIESSKANDYTFDETGRCEG